MQSGLSFCNMNGGGCLCYSHSELISRTCTLILLSRIVIQNFEVLYFGYKLKARHSHVFSLSRQIITRQVIIVAYNSRKVQQQARNTLQCLDVPLSYVFPFITFSVFLGGGS